MTQSNEKAISSHSFENFLTIPLPNSSFLQCAKNFGKFFFRLGHNRDLINLDMTQLTWIWPNGHGYDPWVTVIVSPTVNVAWTSTHLVYPVSEIQLWSPPRLWRVLMMTLLFKKKYYYKIKFSLYKKTKISRHNYHDDLYIIENNLENNMWRSSW